MGTKFDKSTDQEHTIKLESAILSAVWAANEAHIGSEIGVEVKTLFVGEGGTIKITGRTEKGKKLGKIKDNIYGNGFSGKLAIPDKVKIDDYAYFEVELPQLGLSAESNHIPIRPAVIVSNMKWDKAEARRGDTLKLTANVEGVRNGTEVAVIIYEHDQDGNHDKIAELPTLVKNNKIDVQWEYEYHEDTDEIPSQEEMKKYGKNYNPPEYFFMLEIEKQKFGEKQESGLLKFKDWIEIEYIDGDGNPMANADYTITLADGTQKTGKLDSNGIARIDDAPPGIYEVEVSKQ